MSSKLRRIFARQAPIPWIAFLGADGSGKSTVIEGVMKMLDDNKLACELTHWRPGLVAGGNTGNGSPVTDPHAAPPRGLIPSILKLGMLWGDWWMACCKSSAYDASNPKVWISDRFYRDIEVDPIRYRYGAPMWLARGINNLMPRPDLVVILVGDPERIHARKQEVTRGELERQMHEYQQMARFLGESACEVDTTMKLEDTLDAVHQVVNTKLCCMGVIK